MSENYWWYCCHCWVMYSYCIFIQSLKIFKKKTVRFIFPWGILFVNTVISKALGSLLQPTMKTVLWFLVHWCKAMCHASLIVCTSFSLGGGGGDRCLEYLDTALLTKTTTLSEITFQTKINYSQGYNDVCTWAQVQQGLRALAGTAVIYSVYLQLLFSCSGGV